MTNLRKHNTEQAFIPVVQNIEKTKKERSIIKAALEDRFSRIPKEFWADYLDFHKKNHSKFLFQVNCLALLAFWFFGIADYFVLPDIGILSMSIRSMAVVIFFIICVLTFRYIKKIEWLDLYLPYTTIVATTIWFYVLTHSNSADVITFQYASVIFIVLANVGVQIRFLPSLIPSFLISIATCIGVFSASKHDLHQLFIFTFAYFPIVMFSLYIGWNSTYKNRQTFLNALLDENNRKFLDQMAHTDALTSLHNRRYFDHLAEHYLNIMQDQKSSLFLLLFDVDHFKKINDGYGHDIGDEILKTISQITLQNTRDNDILARFGGEEFIMLLPYTSEQEAYMIAQRIRRSIAEHDFIMNDKIMISTSVSIGVAEFLPERHDLRSLTKCADMALYTAKQQGRNRVVMYYSIDAI